MIVCAIAVLVVAWCIGMALFISRASVCAATLPVRRAHPAGPHNLAAAEYGTTVRASSYWHHVEPQHHAAFLIDGRDDPSQDEKWASDRGDASPWVELWWIGEHDIDSVVIHHAGSVEAADYNARDYTITCLRSSGPPHVQRIIDNDASVARHSFECNAAAGVRIDFSRNGKDIVRVYEIEVWGE